MKKRLSLIMSIPKTIMDTFKESKGFINKSYFVIYFIPIFFIVFLHILINPDTIINRGKK